MQIISTYQHNTHHEEDSRILELRQRPRLLLLPPLTSGARNCRNATSYSTSPNCSTTKSARTLGKESEVKAPSELTILNSSPPAQLPASNEVHNQPQSQKKIVQDLKPRVPNQE